MNDRNLFHLRLPPALRSALESEARINHHSLTAEILSRLQHSLEDAGVPQQPAIDVKKMLVGKGKRSPEYERQVEGNAVKESAIFPEQKTLEELIMRQLRALPQEKRALVLSILKLVA